MKAMIKEKYPEIASMSVSDVINLNLFIMGFRKALIEYKPTSRCEYNALKALRKDKALEQDNFRAEYISCMDKLSGRPFSQRNVILAIGDKAYSYTIETMMRNYDSIKEGAAVNLENSII